MLQKSVYFSDVAGSQQKNKALSNLCHHESDSSLNAEWDFFATSHEKSPCDGIGGTVKHLVGNASLQSLQEPINILLKMFACCGKNINVIEFIFVYHDKLESRIVNYGLEERYLTWLTVLGARSFHWYNLAVEHNYKCIVSHLMM